MAGRITSRQKCPACGRSRQYAPAEFRPGERGLRCTCGKSWATKPVIEIKHKGKLYRITCDKKGQRFPAHLQPIETALGQIRSEIQNGTFHAEHWAPASTNYYLWSNYVAEFLKRDQARTAPATAESRKYCVKHLRWFEKIGSIREIRTAHCQDFANLPCLHMACSPVYRREILGLLKRILREAYEREDIIAVPVVPGVSVPEKEIEWLTPEAQALALEHIPEIHRPIFEFMMLYGCRPGEVCALMWDAIDFDKDVIWFKRTFSAGVLNETTKNRKSRPAPLYRAAGAILDRIPRGIGKTFVFQNPTARLYPHYTVKSLQGFWERALKRAGLKHIPLKNGTRHSRGMQLRNQEGWSLENIALVLGHSNSGVTARFYARGEVELVRALVEGEKVAKGLPTGKG